jgi:hypothetical protein
MMLAMFSSKAIHPLAGQREGNVVVLQAVFYLHTDSGQGQIVRATQGEQGKLVVAGFAHPGLNGIHHRVRIHVPRRAGQHARLAKATASGAAPTNFHRQSIVDRFHIGHEPHGVGWHRGGDPAHNPAGTSGGLGLNGTVCRHVVKPGHIDPRHLGQVKQQRFSVEASRFCPLPAPGQFLAATLRHPPGRQNQRSRRRVRGWRWRFGPRQKSRANLHRLGWRLLAGVLAR